MGIGGEDGLPASNCRTAATLKQAKANTANQDHWVICSQRPRTTRGGVIARVEINTRQKLKRPLRSTKDHLG